MVIVIKLYVGTDVRETIAMSYSTYNESVKGKLCRIKRDHYKVWRGNMVFLIYTRNAPMQNVKLGSYFEEPSELNDYVLIVETFDFDYLIDVFFKKSVLYPGLRICDVIARINEIRAGIYRKINNVVRPIPFPFTNHMNHLINNCSAEEAKHIFNNIGY